MKKHPSRRSLGKKGWQRWVRGVLRRVETKAEAWREAYRLFGEPISRRIWYPLPDASIPTPEAQAEYERNGLLAPWERTALAQVAAQRKVSA